MLGCVLAGRLVSWFSDKSGVPGICDLEPMTTGISCWTFGARNWHCLSTDKAGTLIVDVLAVKVLPLAVLNVNYTGLSHRDSIV